MHSVWVPALRLTGVVGQVLPGRCYCSKTSTGMRAWQLNSYGEDMVLKENLPLPEITNPNHMLIRVKAAGVNPVDTRMKGVIRFRQYGL